MKNHPCTPGLVALLVVSLTFPLAALAADPPASVEGHVRDAATGEPLVGVTVLLKGEGRGTVTDAGGYYRVNGVAGDSCTFVVSCISYKSVERVVALGAGSVARLDLALESAVTAIGEVTVSGRTREDTERGMVNAIRHMTQVASGVSSSQIAATPDRLASEVMRRVPGITIIEDRFIVARGLPARYNATWLNGMTLPTEGDGRAFPFDLVPGSQIDHLIVYKSPSPEIPADFSGAFVRVITKGVPDENRLEISLSTGLNTRAGFRPSRHNPGSATDFIGFDAGKRSLSRSFPAHLGAVTDPAEITRLTREGFNNDWSIKSAPTLPDARLSLLLARRFEVGRGEVGAVAAITYSHTASRVTGMKNARYGIYSAAADAPVFLDDYLDDRYSRDARVGVLHGWTWSIAPGHRLEWKNILNVLGNNRLIERAGIKDMSSMYYRVQTEIRYASRVAYAGQIAGSHEARDGARYTWDVGYSLADRSEPDRRIITYHEGIGSPEDIPTVVPVNESITRYFQHAGDHGLVARADYARPFRAVAFKGGLLGEFRRRELTPREFIYRYDKLSHEERQRYLRLPFQEMLHPDYLAADKVYIDEITRKTSAFQASTALLAAHAAAEWSRGNISIRAGARFEYYYSRLSRDRADDPSIILPATNKERAPGLFPSINACYRWERHQLRLAYGRSINRPDPREVSPTVYYDFDLFSEIGGNENLKTAVIDNLDLRHEFYPSSGETLSVALFYKHFRHPIEWTFIDMGGSLRYNHENAGSAVNWGLEIDARKQLGNFTALLNLAWIRSNVRFKPGEVVSEPDRPMQGQSPYLLNAAIFYKKAPLHLSLLYNRVGKRIVGLGKSNSVQPDVNTRIPDAYEMPRDLLDGSVRLQLGRVELQCAIKDVLSAPVVYKQFPRFSANGTTHRREQITRQFRPGCSVSAGVTFNIQ
ncbi:MAG: TonB-dependent receptor [Odoribacteraceae bacterium]|jgi:outer membrane receptor protein involved in Fe transport|nr:TonB-dependent receptor [Odoribacteraceae bacterium]